MLKNITFGGNSAKSGISVSVYKLLLLETFSTVNNYWVLKWKLAADLSSLLKYFLNPDYLFLIFPNKFHQNSWENIATSGILCFGL